MLSKFSVTSLTWLVVSLFTFGCASTYKQVNTAALPYRHTTKINDSLTVSYAYNVQNATLNKRYGAKERKYGYAAVALKIRNTSPVPLMLTRRTFHVQSSNGPKQVMSARSYASKVRQRVGAHMLHALWGPWRLSWKEDTYGETDVNFIYIPIGLFVGIGNAARASNANKQHMSVMESNEIWNKEILPGKTLFGIITIRAQGEEELTFIYGRNADSLASPEIDASSYLPRKKIRSSVYNLWLRPLGANSYQTTSRIYTDEGRHHVDGRDAKNRRISVFPNETESLISITPSGKRIVGMPAGDQWVFKVVEGRINAYFYLPDEEPKYVTLLQKDNGPMLEFTPATLIEMVEDDPDAVKLIDDGKYVDAIILFNAKR